MENIQSLSVNEAVVFAIKTGMSNFLSIIRFYDACKQLKTDEAEIIEMFALFLLEKKANPIYQYRGDNQAAFKTYITVVFRHWLIRELKRNRLETTDLTDQGYTDKDPTDFEVIDALNDCTQKLSKEDKNLIELKLYQNKTFEEIAQALGSKLTKITNRFYTILGILKKCLSGKGFNSFPF